MDKFEAMNAFTKVVAMRSFAEAGRRLGLTRSAVSKAVMELERALGARLLDRTTRRVAPTEAGLAYYERCIAILAQLEETELQVSRLHDEPRGVLKINAPMTFGMLYLGSAVADFMARYADLTIELTLNDRFIDPLEEGVDVTVRIGTLTDSSLIARRLVPARRVLAAAAPILAQGGTVVGLEPSCLLTLRDEFSSMLPGPETERLASRSQLLEEFLAAELAAGRIKGPIASRRATVLLHGHCHQKAFGAMPAIQTALGLVEGLAVETVESSCCGMAGAFGYGADTHPASVAMGELSLLPAVRKAAPDALIVADGFSCRHQIHDGTGRTALHVSRLLCDAMAQGPA
jgi:DNA-binding transcriptional LysR family regulator